MNRGGLVSDYSNLRRVEVSTSQISIIRDEHRWEKRARLAFNGKERCPPNRRRVEPWLISFFRGGPKIFIKHSVILARARSSAPIHSFPVLIWKNPCVFLCAPSHYPGVILHLTTRHFKLPRSKSRRNHNDDIVNL
jgi:hypothetical protein